MDHLFFLLACDTGLAPTLLAGVPRLIRIKAQRNPMQVVWVSKVQDAI